MWFHFMITGYWWVTMYLISFHDCRLMMSHYCWAYKHESNINYFHAIYSKYKTTTSLNFFKGNIIEVNTIKQYLYINMGLRRLWNVMHRDKKISQLNLAQLYSLHLQLDWLLRNENISQRLRCSSGKTNIGSIVRVWKSQRNIKRRVEIQLLTPWQLLMNQ